MLNSLPASVRPHLHEIAVTAEKWWSNVGLFTRSLAALSLVLSILFFIPFHDYFGNIPQASIQSLQFYRLFMFPLVSPSLFWLLISFYAYLPESNRREHEYGTFLTFLDFLFVNLQIGILYALPLTLLGIMHSQMIGAPSPLLTGNSSGLFPVFLVYLTRRCMQSPTSVVQFCGLPVELKAFHYPIAVVALLTIATRSIELDLLIALALGYYGESLPAWTRLNVSHEKISSLERNTSIAAVTNHPNFVSVNALETGGHSLPVSTREMASSSKSGSASFSGRGQSVGSTKQDAEEEMNEGTAIEIGVDDSHEEDK